VFLLLAASGGDMLFPGYVPRSVAVVTLEIREFQQLQSQKPKQAYTNEVPFHLYELVPEPLVVSSTLSYDDTAAQVAGFYRSESPLPDDQRAAWTDGRGVLRLPAEAQGQQLVLRAAGGLRPRSLGDAELCLYVAPEPIPYPEGDIRDTAAWQRLTCTALGEDFKDIEIALPVLDGKSSLLLQLRSDPWVPASVPPDPGAPVSPDARPLGVLWAGAQLTR
jgi:hypothetical protein